MPAEGQPIPHLTGPSTHGPFDSAQLVGKPFVLYFYPRDNTPGCTTEAQDFRDLHVQFEALGCTIFGVSRDAQKSHERFAEKQSLPFALISDPEETLCTLFGVMKNKNMYGKQVRGIERSTFLIDGAGILQREWRAVRVPGHAAEVLQAVQALGT
ncbi:peroxiredoxin [Castellaniella sp.]|uniref:peroxiredoxin n=1 Tax=Castellaniella sp. TaxID=1955812 RepID=UPI00355EDE1F